MKINFQLKSIGLVLGVIMLVYGGYLIGQNHAQDKQCNTLYSLVGKLVWIDFDRCVAPVDTLFEEEIRVAFPTMSINDKIRFLNWAGFRYENSSSIMSYVVRTIHENKLDGLMNYSLTVMEDNTTDEKIISSCQKLRAALLR